MERVLITGMYRSATTFVERYIDAKPEATILHQPFPSVFKIILDELTRKKGEFSLGDYPFSLKELNNFNFSNLFIERNVVLSHIEKDASNVANHQGVNKTIFPDEKFYKFLASCFSNYNSTISAEQIFTKLYESIESYYQPSGISGFKEIFGAELLYGLSKLSLNNMIVCIRDPREIYYSRNYVKSQEVFGILQRHPVIMIANIWKRQAQIVRDIEKNLKNNKLTIIDYNILKNNEKLVKKEIDILVKSQQNSIIKNWVINTSGDKGTTGFGSGWPDKMRKSHIAVIEKVCRNEMEYMGYKLLMDPEEASVEAKKFKEDFSDVRPWAQLEKYAQL